MMWIKLAYLLVLPPPQLLLFAPVVAHDEDEHLLKVFFYFIFQALLTFFMCAQPRIALEMYYKWWRLFQGSTIKKMIYHHKSCIGYWLCHCGILYAAASLSFQLYKNPLTSIEIDSLEFNLFYFPI